MEGKRPVRRRPDEHHFSSRLMVAVTVAAAVSRVPHVLSQNDRVAHGVDVLPKMLYIDPVTLKRSRATLRGYSRLSNLLFSVVRHA